VLPAVHDVIEVRDPRLVAVHLEPVPANQIRLNDLVVLPDRGELSPVIGIWPCAGRYARLLYVCTDNGDWTRRRVDSPLLRADIRSPNGTARRAGDQAVPTARRQAPHSAAPHDEEPGDG
jgi:hypothetical protein